LVNLINRTPSERFRHAILCLTESGSFEQRLDPRKKVPVIALHGRPGHHFGEYLKVWKALKLLRPAVVHTRNLSALEAQIPAFFLRGVKRAHGVHGRDVFDLEGKNRKYNLLRKSIRPLVGKYTTVSRDLRKWLIEAIGVSPDKVVQIYNGVDQDRFHPGERQPGLAPAGFLDDKCMVIGTVGRLAAVKDQATLVRAFALLRKQASAETAQRLRLVLVGDGPSRGELEKLVAELELGEQAWLAGDREDIPEMLRLFDLFVLPSLGEGISNTILEAMATGLPVVATRVGGNPELVGDDKNGRLVQPGDPDALARLLREMVETPELRRDMGAAGLERVRRHFDWNRTVERYLAVYDELLAAG
jgi:sugar transferase (PEP-CTERM/EpsH1 system associated)